ncbi:hypothetical protein OGD13_001378 [Enterobacter hormaechei]|nr:hypothetical protein [Enterobacter hormaechei]
MITLTKEWLLKTIAELEEERDATPGTVNEDAAMALAAMKLALASLEADSKLSGFVESQESLGVEFEGVLTENIEELYVPSKSTPPAPVSVPDVPFDENSPYDVPCRMPSNLRELIAEEIGILFSDDDAQSVWDVCRRAAMLQGAERGSNRDELTDVVNGLLAVMDEYPETLVPINRDSALVRQLRVAAGD